MLQEILSKGDAEEGLRCFFVMAIHFVPYVRRGMDSSHGAELEVMLRQYICRFFNMVAERRGYYAQYTAAEAKTISRYHGLAVFGLLQEWTDQDTAQLDQIVHTVYRLMTTGMPPQI